MTNFVTFGARFCKYVTKKAFFKQVDATET